MTQHTTHPHADRNLLFGILALQMDFITRDALIQGMHAWVLDKDKSLGHVLVDLKALTPERRALLEPLVNEHVKQHGNDAQRSLAALSSVDSIRNELNELADPDVEASVACLPRRGDADPSATRDVSRGTPNAEGLRYRILRPHARGNLGEVFIAQDAELHREVALKEIQGTHADHPESRARFVLEAEITGGLEHPGIVPVYGLGTYADGRPFYAMRFIKGDNLKEAIDRFHALDVAGRDPGQRHLSYLQMLKRFVDVCNAVAYAHARGVLHRDLKPGNIMLGKYGETLVVDWGLAKTVDRPESLNGGSDEKTLRPSSGSSAVMTQAGMVVGTPAYMSPEQAAGRLDELGPASDVYSLGATLYSVLTGTSPVSSADAGEVLRKVERGDITPPRRIKRDIPPALEAVCLKAMAVTPGDRYTSALALAADVEQWIADQPVAAYQERWWERGRRWLRRHRTLATSAAATLMVALLLSSGAAVLLNIARENEKQAGEREKQARFDEEAQRKEAQKQEKQATAVADLLVKSFRRPDPSMDGRELKVVDVLEQALKEVDPSVAYDDATTARLLDALGKTFRGLGLPTKAMPLHERARGLRSQVLGPDHPDTLSSMNNLAESYRAAGRYAEALTLHEETFKLAKLTLGPDHQNTLASMNNLAETYRAAGQYDRALPLHENALKHFKAKVGPDHPDTLSSMHNLALVYQDTGRFAEALPRFDETFNLRKAKLGADHPQTLKTMDHLARAYQNSGRLTEALPLFEQAFRLSTAKLGPDHADTLGLMNDLASAYQAGGRLTEALPLYEDALKLCNAKLGPDHPRTLVSMNNLALAYDANGRPAAALPLFEENLKRKKAKLGSDHPGTLLSMSNLAVAYKANGRFTDALPLFEETLKLEKAKLGADHPHTLMSMNNLAEAYRAVGRPTEALPLFEETLKLSKAKLGSDHPQTLKFMHTLARAYQDNGRLTDALLLFEETLKLSKGKLGLEQPDTVETMIGLARCFLQQGKFEQAEPHLREAVSIYERKHSHDWRYFTTQSLLGAALAGENKFPESESFLLSGYEGLKAREATLPFPANLEVSDALDRIIQLYDAWEKPDNAAEWRARREEMKQMAERLERLRLAVAIVGGWPVVR